MKNKTLLVLGIIALAGLTGCSSNETQVKSKNSESTAISSTKSLNSTTESSIKESHSTVESTTKATNEIKFTKEEQSAINASKLIADDFQNKIAGKWSGSVSVFQMIGSAGSVDYELTLNFNGDKLDMTEKNTAEKPTDVVYSYEYKVDVNALASNLIGYTDDFSDIQDYDSFVSNYKKFNSAIGYLPLIITGSYSGVSNGKSISNSAITYNLSLAYEDMQLKPLGYEGLFTVNTPTKFTRN